VINCINAKVLSNKSYHLVTGNVTTGDNGLCVAMCRTPTVIFAPCFKMNFLFASFLRRIKSVSSPNVQYLFCELTGNISSPVSSALFIQISKDRHIDKPFLSTSSHCTLQLTDFEHMAVAARCANQHEREHVADTSHIKRKI
jgi:hypothetical protein